MTSIRRRPSICARSAGERLSRRSLLAAGAGAALASCAPRSALTEAPVRDGTADWPARRITVDGVPLTYVRAGSGPALVLIHGASGNLRDWTFRAAPAFARDFEVIAFDRPGHGLSGWPAEGGETLALQARLMRAALARMGIPRAIVVGHSYGGSVALAWALDAPESVAGLMLISAPSEVWEGGLGLATELLANPLSGPVLARALPVLVTPGLARAAADRVFAPQEVPEGYVAHLELDLVLRSLALRRNARQLDALKGQVARMVPLYPRLSMPVEIVHGTADDTVPLDIHSEPLSRTIPGARLSRLEGIGHMPHQVALPAVEAILARLAERAA